MNTGLHSVDIDMNRGSATTPVTVRPWLISKWLLTITAVLVVLSLAANAYGLSQDQLSLAAERVIKLVDLDDEANAPAFFSTVLLLLATALLAAVARHQHSHRERDARHWWALTVVFLALSFDEAAEIHETMIGPFQRLFEGNRFVYFGWVVPGAAFVVVVGLFFLRFLFELEPKTRNRFILAGAIFVGGALGIEVVEGYIASGRGEDNWTYVIAFTMQELLEMVGIVVFIHAILDHLSRLTSGLDVAWDTDR